MKILSYALGAIALSLTATQSFAKVDAAEAGKLGAALSPVGAEKAANKDGSIPAWAPAPQKGTLKGEFTVNPAIEAETPKFTITKANVDKYKDQLSEGHKYLLKTFDTYKMNVYPSHRQASFPQFIYDATKSNATTCTLDGTDILDGCKVGFPFPIPKSGAEVIWNHKLKWRGDAVTRYNNQMIVQPSGEFQLTKIVEDVQFSYAVDKNPVPLTKTSGEFLKYLSRTVSPPRLAGTFILVHEKAGTGNDGRAAWLYSPGLKRIRRAPTVCCDNPYEGTDGHEFYDQVDLFNGALDRYNWKLIGKKDMIIGYDGFKMAGPGTKFKDMAKPKHLNQDISRYEPHRVWVVEATIKPGTSHTFAKRVMYVDEDTWNIVQEDDYDTRGNLLQFHEGNIVWAPNVQAATTIPEVIYHLTSGRYFITAVFNEDKPVDLTANFGADYFTAASVQKMSTK